MIPHLYMHEQLMLERVRKWQREAKQLLKLLVMNGKLEE